MSLIEYGQLYCGIKVIYRVQQYFGGVNRLEAEVRRPTGHKVQYSEWCNRYEPIEDEI